MKAKAVGDLSLIAFFAFVKALRIFARKYSWDPQYYKQVSEIWKLSEYGSGSPGAGYGLGQGRVDLVQQDAFRRTLREGLFLNAFFAGAFYEIPDFKIVFIFKWFFDHKGRLPIT